MLSRLRIHFSRPFYFPFRSLIAGEHISVELGDSIPYILCQTIITSLIPEERCLLTKLNISG